VGGSNSGSDNGAAEWRLLINGFNDQLENVAETLNAIAQHPDAPHDSFESCTTDWLWQLMARERPSRLICDQAGFTERLLT
jgi:hypothetical protein